MFIWRPKRCGGYHLRNSRQCGIKHRESQCAHYSLVCEDKDVCVWVNTRKTVVQIIVRVEQLTVA